MISQSIGKVTVFLTVAIVLLTLTTALRAGSPLPDGYGWSPDFNLRGVQGGVLALAHDGKDFYVGGDVNMVAGVEVNRIFRWDGSTVDDMDGGPNMWVMDFAKAEDGTLYASGYFTEIGGGTGSGASCSLGWSALACFWSRFRECCDGPDDRT